MTSVEASRMAHSASQTDERREVSRWLFVAGALCLMPALGGCGPKLPEYYGVYAKDGSKYVDIGQSSAGQARPDIHSKDSFLIYDKVISSMSQAELDTIRLYNLVQITQDVEEVRDSTGQVVNRNVMPLVNTFRSDGQGIQLRFKPAKSSTDMLEASPASPLRDGAYVLSVPNSSKFYSFTVGLKAANRDGRNLVSCREHHVSSRAGVGLDNFLAIDKHTRLGNILVWQNDQSCDYNKYTEKLFKIDNHDYDAKIRLAKEQLKIDPYFYNVLTDLAEAYFQKGDYKSAVEYFSRSLDSTPKAPRSLAGRGLAYMKLGNTAASQADFQAADALTPDAVETARRQLLGQ